MFYFIKCTIILALLCASVSVVTSQSPIIEERPTANGTVSSRPSTTQTILYGLLATTITNMAALLGLIFSPLHRWRHYSVVISFMVATAVGSLFSTAVLVLIPEALGLVRNSDSTSTAHSYVPISITLCAGSFGFFVLEFALRRLRLYLERQSNSSQVQSRNDLLKRPAPCTEVMGSPECGPDSSNPEQGDTNNCSLSVVVNGTLDGHCHSVRTGGGDSVHHRRDSIKAPNTRPATITLCGPDLCRRLARLDPVVWMVVLGDGLHNFMDGLSIGAGFSSDLRLGFSLSLAILCEELPHELGDFAILLRSGLSVGMAVLFNFGSACTAYLGFFLGVYLGEMTNASTFILAITAGFFLYISLADMLPEMRKSEDERILVNESIVGLFFVHMFGLLFGFGCILAVSLLSDSISL